MTRKPVVFVPGFPASSLKNAGGPLFPPGLPQVQHDVDRKKWLETLRAKDDPADTGGISAVEPIRHSANVFGRWGLFRQAEILYDVLEKAGYQRDVDFKGVGWDWRLPVDHANTQTALRSAIDSL